MMAPRSGLLSAVALAGAALAALASPCPASSGQSRLFAGGGHTPRARHHASSRAIRSRTGRQNQSPWSRVAAATMRGMSDGACAGSPLAAR